MIRALFALLTTMIFCAAARAAEPARAINTYELPTIRLSNVSLPGSIKPPANDRRIALGGLSDLWRSAADPVDEVWAITDRGPNGQEKVDGGRRRTFPVPDFTPLILRLKLKGDRAEIVQVIPLLTPDGQPVSGLPNHEADGPGYSFDGKERLPWAPDGLDTEGLVRTPGGDFWIAEEYGPSLVKVDATGHVRKRFAPIGAAIAGAHYPVIEALPAVYARRETNRGFEGLALDPNGRTLLAMLESPLENPDHETGAASANARILAFDVGAERAVGEYVYCFDPPQSYGKGAKPHNIKVSGMAALAATKLLVLEHTQERVKIFLAELDRASNILSTPASADQGRETSLEARRDPGAAGARPVAKRLLLDLDDVAGLPEKLEGLAILGRGVLAVVNDNDFGFEGFDRRGDAISNGVGTRIMTFAVPEAVLKPESPAGKSR